ERLSTSEDSGGPCTYAYDDTLGWSLSACATPRYNVGADGFRRTPGPSTLAEPPILATGASFTLGEQVADDESWPAYLQTLIGRFVLADEIVKRLGIQRGWYFDEVQAVPSGMGATIACLLMPRLAAVGVPVVVVAQYGRTHWKADAEHKARDFRAVRKVLDCA